MSGSRDIARGLDRVRERMVAACRRAGRDPSTVSLVAVSKTHGPDAIRDAYGAGQRAFGENYVQELVQKESALRDLPGLVFHFVGHLQRNKAKEVVRAARVVESVDSLRLAEELARRAEAAETELTVYLQVNIGAEPQKSGCEPRDLSALTEAVCALDRIHVAGLMTIPPAAESAEASRPYFRRTRQLAEDLGLTGVSMGMSHDFEVAIEEGATVVRVGTAVFGPRRSRPR